ncbi:hypothetical protein MAE02_58910 [Microvirga aerophila]|uniref:Uncharacterized protein n=1 Tax=Microvirga aerophila TaxID=670291 RepID=A0A512C1U3_9HYPH|nr:hypothetical protein MAE02_58910 [Microvirga aerophila]
MAPSYIRYRADELAVFDEPGVSVRLIAGRAFGLTNRVRTQSPLFYIHAGLQADNRIAIPTSIRSEPLMWWLAGWKRTGGNMAQGRCWSSPAGLIPF